MKRLFTLLAASLHLTASALPEYSGVWSINNPNTGTISSTQVAQCINKPGVEGHTIRIFEDKFHTGSGQYNWSMLDSQIGTVIAQGKKVKLSIASGTHTPSWIYAAGAKYFTSSAGKVPLYWDPVFLKHHTDMVKALGAHIAANVIFKSALVAVTISGINYTTPELKTAPKMPYTASQISSAFSAIAKAYNEAFPDYWIELITIPNAIPSPSGDLTASLITAGKSIFGSRFVVANDGLSTFYTAGYPTKFAQAGGKISFQALWWVYQETTYRMNNYVADTWLNIMVKFLNRAFAAKAINGLPMQLELYCPDVQQASLVNWPNTTTRILDYSDNKLK